jgi:DNA-binding transcriptional LysR family regulator
VADASSVTRAAERLNISQPPLTRQIQQLEHELGVTLFIRHRLGVTLTEAGCQLLEKARAWDAAAAEFAETARRVSQPDNDRIRVGIAWGLWDAVNGVRMEFAKERPDVSFEATDAHCWFDSDEQLRTRAIDIAFARPPYDPVFDVSAPLFEERIQAIISADSPLASRRSLSIRDLASEPLLLWERHAAPVLFDKILDLYATAEVATPMITTPGAGPFNLAGMTLVASGKGIYLGYGVPLTNPSPASGVAVVPVDDPGATIEVCLVWRKSEMSPLVRQFVACTQRMFTPPAEEPVLVRAEASTGA